MHDSRLFREGVARVGTLLRMRPAAQGIKTVRLNKNATANQINPTRTPPAILTIFDLTLFASLGLTEGGVLLCSGGAGLAGRG